MASGGLIIIAIPISPPVNTISTSSENAVLGKGLSQTENQNAGLLSPQETLGFVLPARADAGGGGGGGVAPGSQTVAQTYPQAKVEQEEHVESHVDL